MFYFFFLQILYLVKTDLKENQKSEWVLILPSLQSDGASTEDTVYLLYLKNLKPNVRKQVVQKQKPSVSSASQILTLVIHKS